jgi:hypothetical protein
MKWHGCHHLICMFIITICSVSSDNVVDDTVFLNVSASNQWKYIGPGACSVLGVEGKHGPNLIHPRLDLDDCVNYGDKAGVSAVTMYGDGFCMLQFPTRKDCLYSNLRIFDNWITACGTEPNPAGNYTNDMLRGFQCFMKVKDLLDREADAKH